MEFSVCPILNIWVFFHFRETFHYTMGLWGEGRYVSTLPVPIFVPAKARHPSVWLSPEDETKFSAANADRWESPTDFPHGHIHSMKGVAWEGCVCVCVLALQHHTNQKKKRNLPTLGLVWTEKWSVFFRVNLPKKEGKTYGWSHLGWWKLKSEKLLFESWYLDPSKGAECLIRGAEWCWYTIP